MEHLKKKAQTVRMLMLDVDGILTNGVLYYGNDDIEIKGFHIHDGMGISLLQKVGIGVSILSGKTSEAIIKRIKDLSIDLAFLNLQDKLPAYEEIKNTLNLKDHEIAYMGDDLIDLPILSRVGFAITVPEAPDIIKQQVHFVTQKEGGFGAVREICDLIMLSQDKYKNVIQSYLIS